MCAHFGTYYYRYCQISPGPERAGTRVLKNMLSKNYHECIVLLSVLLVVVVEAQENDITTAGSIYAVLSIIVGLALNLCGYRFLKPTVFIAAAIFGGMIAYDLSEQADSSLSEGAQTGLAIAAGVILGFLAVFCLELGIFLLGAAAGAVLGQILTTSVLYRITENDTDTVLWVTVIICAILCGVLTVVYRRPIIIILSAWLGAGIAIRGIGYFAGDYPTSLDFIRNDNVVVPSEWYAYLFAPILLFIIGAWYQFRSVKRNPSDFHAV